MVINIKKLVLCLQDCATMMEEKGDLKCEIGVVFEVATIVGVKLFEADDSALSKHLRQTKDKLALLPKSVRRKSKTIRDDF